MSTFDEGRDYDIIFAGGGTTACVAAGRLAAAEPSLSILMIERGKNNLNDPITNHPAIFIANLLPETQKAVFYQAESEPALNGRASIISTGGVLGGGSSINAMMYSRAQAIDFDSFQMEGWDSESLMEYAKKLETVHLDNASLNMALHGASGSITVSMGTHAPKGPQDDFLAAAQSYGIPEVQDFQDFKSAHGFNRSPKYIGIDGSRQDTAHRYIHPLMADGKHPNLHILPESKVNRVVFEGNQAVGVEYEPEPTFLKQDISLTKKVTKTVKAKKLVVVSAGTLGTPLILERSGIGNKKLLANLDIPLISDLPGVGENYQDHHFLLCAYKTNLNPDETMDCLYNGRKDFMTAVSKKDPFLGWNGVDIIGKLRMTEDEVATMDPDFKAVWDKDFAPSPTKPLMLMCVISFFVGDHKILDAAGEDPQAQYITMATYTPYPYSRGSIHITSPDCNIPPKLVTGFLADKNDIDLKKSVWAYKKGRDLYRRTNAFAGELAIGHPKFREGSKAALADGSLKKGGFEDVENRKEIPPIEYDEEDVRAIEDFIRSNVSTTWHSLGTCKMAPREKGGVADKDLNVYGTQGLKCADLSVIPENIGANTNNTAMIVGEKVADIIGKELGIVV